MPEWTSVTPFVIAITLAMITKQVFPGLGLGLLTGSFLVNPSFVGGFRKALEFLTKTISNSDNIEILLFLYLFGGLVGMMQVAGGIQGFSKVMTPYMKSEKQILMFTWLSNLITFLAPAFRIVAVTPVIRPVAEKENLDERRIAYAIDVSTMPLIVLMPVGTVFVGYMVSLLGDSLQRVSVPATSYTVFLQSLPFNVFAWVMMGIGIFAAVTGRYIGELDQEVHESRRI